MEDDTAALLIYWWM